MITRRHLLRSLGATTAAIAIAPVASFAGLFRPMRRNSAPKRSLTVRCGEVRLIPGTHYDTVTILGGVCIATRDVRIDKVNLIGGSFVTENNAIVSCIALHLTGGSCGRLAPDDMLLTFTNPALGEPFTP